MKLDLPLVSMKVKELETIEDELRSKLEVKSKEIEKLENENKSVLDKYVQLKAKHNLIEDEPISQENEREVCSYMCYVYIIILL